MSAVFNMAIDAIDAGRRGLNEGLSHGLERMSEYIPGVQRGNLYLIGGMTSSGKSALAMSMFVNNPYEDWITTEKRNLFKLKIFVWSMEISKEILMTKFLCRRIFIDHGILVDINYVLSRGKHRVSQEIYNLVVSYREYYAQYEEYVKVIGSANPEAIKNTLLDYYHLHGKDKYNRITIPGTMPGDRQRTIETYDHYEADAGYENSYVIGVVDHANILKRGYAEGRQLSKKETIDQLVNNFIELSNNYKFTGVILQQVNRGVESNERLYGKTPQTDLQLSDFKETGDTTDAAHFVLAINNPQRWDNMKMYRGYDLTLLKNRARFIKVLKNRDGNVDVGVAVSFLGEIGAFRELPPAESMRQTDYAELDRIAKYIGHSQQPNN